MGSEDLQQYGVRHGLSLRSGRPRDFGDGDGQRDAGHGDQHRRGGASRRQRLARLDVHASLAFVQLAGFIAGRRDAGVPRPRRRALQDQPRGRHAALGVRHSGRGPQRGRLHHGRRCRGAQRPRVRRQQPPGAGHHPRLPPGGRQGRLEAADGHGCEPGRGRGAPGGQPLAERRGGRGREPGVSGAAQPHPAARAAPDRGRWVLPVRLLLAALPPLQAAGAVLPRVLAVAPV
mmetsp:Transcript_111769/g.271543  ORF Transcript_111769/g.271543 Transcript_111769/m.271543 type:complete len:232 (-) Transcript_111769:499-1194(-)